MINSKCDVIITSVEYMTRQELKVAQFDFDHKTETSGAGPLGPIVATAGSWRHVARASAASRLGPAQTPDDRSWPQTLPAELRASRPRARTQADFLWPACGAQHDLTLHSG